MASNTGAHLELAYRQSLTFGYPYSLQTGARIDQNGGFGYVDLLLPPKPNGARDSVGALVEDSDIEDLRVKRWSVGAARARLRGTRAARHIETKLGVNFEHEERKTPLDPVIELDTMSTTYTWIRRDVDEIINPRRGNVIELEGTVGASGTNLERRHSCAATGASSQYFPMGERDVLIVRGELGAVKVDTADVVPTRFLFRTGGSTTVRGYDYESLGVSQRRGDCRRTRTGIGLGRIRALAAALGRQLGYCRIRRRGRRRGLVQGAEGCRRCWSRACAGARWPVRLLSMSRTASAKSSFDCTFRWPSRSNSGNERIIECHASPTLALGHHARRGFRRGAADPRRGVGRAYGGCTRRAADCASSCC